MDEELREQALEAALRAAAMAPVLNRNEAAFIAHMLTEMDILRPAVDAALETIWHELQAQGAEEVARRVAVDRQFADDVVRTIATTVGEYVEELRSKGEL